METNVKDPRVWRMFEHLKTVNAPNATEEQLWNSAVYLIHAGSLQFAFAAQQTRNTTEEHAREELAKLTKLADNLVNHMRTMHRTSLDAVRVAGKKLDLKGRLPMRDPLVTRQDVHTLAMAAHNANIDRLPTPPAERKTPKHFKKTAHDVADMAAKVFHSITGESPYIGTEPYSPRDGQWSTRPSGTFYRLLKETFDILGINASPEAMGDAASARFKAGRKIGENNE
jgi:hypothetical protein